MFIISATAPNAGNDIILTIISAIAKNFSLISLAHSSPPFAQTTPQF